MNIQALGRVPVPTPGTPVLFAAMTGTQILITTAANNVGNVYVGVPGMNKTTGAGVICVLPKITSSSVAAFNPIVMTGQDALYLAEFAIDADTAGDGAYVSVFTS